MSQQPSVQIFGYTIPVPDHDTVFEAESVHLDPATGRQICLFFESMKKSVAADYPVRPGWVELDFEAWVTRYRIVIRG